MEKKELKNKKIEAFSNGESFRCWNFNMCKRCQRRDDDISKTCPLEYEIGLACIGDGKIPVETAILICGSDKDFGLQDSIGKNPCFL